jgi:hypothetical protein
MKKKIEFKLEENLFNEYKSYCEKNGYDMSKRLRLFIESEIPIKYDLIKVYNILHEPINEFENINIMGFNFISIKQQPKVFVIQTEDDISDNDNISFYYKNMIYKLEGCIVNTMDSHILIECKKFIIESIYK